jgi:hypothetical protein
MPDDRTPSHNAMLIAAGVSALLAAIVFRRWLSAEFALLQGIGLLHLDVPASGSPALGWLSFIHARRGTGLLLLNGFDLVNYVLVVVMYYGVYSVLRHRWASVRLAMGLAAVGFAVYLASIQSFNLLSMSGRYFAATDDGERMQILTAARTALDLNDPTTFGNGLFWSYVAFYSSGLAMALSMLRSRVFGRWASACGIAASGFGLGYFFTSALAPGLAIVAAVGSAPLTLVWYILCGLRLLRMARRADGTESTPESPA